MRARFTATAGLDAAGSHVLSVVVVIIIIIIIIGGGGGFSFGVGQELAGCGFIGAGDQHPNPVHLQLRFLAPGVVRRHDGPYAIAAQQARDQVRFGAAGDLRHRYVCDLTGCSIRCP